MHAQQDIGEQLPIPYSLLRYINAIISAILSIQFKIKIMYTIKIMGRKRTFLIISSVEKPIRVVIF